jgi:hypothetical protein
VVREDKKILMKQVFEVAKIVCVLALSSCAMQSNRATELNYDYSVEASISAPGGFAWVDVDDNQIPDQRAKNAPLNQQIQKAIEQALREKKFHQTTWQNAEFLVDYHISMSSQERKPSGGGFGRFSVLLPSGGSRTYPEGMLVIDVLEMPGRRLVWQGFSTRNVYYDVPSKKSAAYIDEIVEQVLDSFPPPVTFFYPSHISIIE